MPIATSKIMLNGFKSLGRRLKYPAILTVLTLGFWVFLYPGFNLPSRLFHGFIGANVDMLCFHIWRAWWYQMLWSGLWALRDPAMLLSDGIIRAEGFLHAGNILDQLVFSVPLAALYKFPAWWNLKFLVILILNAWAAYALLKDWLPDPPVAVFAAMLLNFNPFAFKLLTEGRARELCFFGLLLFTRYFFQSLTRPGLLYPIVWGLWLGLTAVFYWFYALQGLMFMGFYLLLVRCYPPLSARHLARNVILGMTCFALIIAPFVRDYFSPGAPAGLSAYAGKVEVKLWQDFPLKEIPEQHLDEQSGFFLHNASMMLGESQPLWLSFSYLGILLALAALILVRRRIVVLFACMAVLFYLLALGPYFKVAPPQGQGELARNFPAYRKSDFITFRGRPLPNPVFMGFYKYCPPFTRQIRPDRYLISAYIFLALLAGLGGVALSQAIRFKGFGIGMVAVLLLTLFFLGELVLRGYLPLPYMSYQLPKFYTRLANQARAGIIELPLSSRVIAEKKLTLTGFAVPGAVIPKSEIYDRVNFYQSLHHKRLYGSAISIAGALPGQLLDLPGYDCAWEDSPGNTFIAYLGLLAEKFKPQDKDSLVQEGYAYVLMHESCNLPESELALYRKMTTRLTQSLGPPIAVQAEIWQVGQEQRLGKLLIYRM